MKRPSKSDPPFDRRRGVALVLALALIALVMALLVAFLARSSVEQQVSAGSLNATKVDQLARSACDAIVADLKDEIANGSTVQEADGVKIYFPATPQDAVPSLSDSTAIIGGSLANLVKFSKRDIPFYTTSNGSGGVAASAVSSTAVSMNGRSVTPERWNAAYLLPRDPAATGTNPASAAPDPARFPAPDWVLVSRKGAITASDLGGGETALNNPKADNENYVIGRYAFMVYDEGGLLDLNVAGTPGKVPTVGTVTGANETAITRLRYSTYGRKGGLPFVELGQLKVGGSALLTEANIDNIVGWRNYATAMPGGEFGSYSFSPPSSTANNSTVRWHLNTIDALATTGMTGVRGSGALTDNAFLSRQQLIRFWRGAAAGSGSATALNFDALRFLGTFTREKNAPSHVQPVGDPYRPGIKSDINPDVLRVRFKQSADLTRYRLDGSTHTVSVKAGEPLVQVRFPLGRIAWLTPDGPNPAIPNAAAAIKKHFGLVWVDDAAAKDHSHWVYTSPDGTSASDIAHEIKTLAQVADAGREPDFFELLKAGILEGSLGKTTVPANNNPDPGIQVTSGESAFRTAAVDVNTSIHVLRIGANIIDQYDADSIPTTLRIVNNETMISGEKNIAVDCFGTESLPYLNRLIALPYRPRPGEHAAGIADRTTLGCWLSFCAWDPHQNASAAARNNVPNMATTLPGNFRIAPIPAVEGAGLGALTLQVIWFSGSTPENPNVVIASLSATTPLTANGYITFNRSSENFSEPTFINRNFADADQADNKVSISSGTGSPGFVGYLFGTVPNAGAVHDNTLNYDVWANGYAVGISQSPWVAFELQCKDPATGRWHAYQQVKHMNGSGSTGDPDVKKDAQGKVSNPAYMPFTRLISSHAWFLTDPRSMRFGGQSRIQRTDCLAATPGAGYPANDWILGPGIASTSPNMGAWGSANTTASPGTATALSLYPRYGGFTKRGVGWWLGNNSTVTLITTSAPEDGGAASVSDTRLSFASYVEPAAPGGPPRLTIPLDNNTGKYLLYSDPDGVFRAADPHKALYPMRPATDWTAPSGYPTSMDQERPLVLNRPFRSVAELGYAFRDMPFRSLDFWHPASADTALLDLFTIADAELVAGKINLNSRNPEVLAAVIAGAQTMVEVPSDQLKSNNVMNPAQSPNGALTEAQAKTFAEALVERTTGGKPFVSRANISDALAEVADAKTVFPDGPQRRVKAHREAPVRALADAGQARTWNLLIDVIAQTGRYPRTAAGASLDRFNVEGERRYWLHVAIDRFTGEIIDQQWEAVNE